MAAPNPETISFGAPGYPLGIYQDGKIDTQRLLHAATVVADGVQHNDSQCTEINTGIHDAFMSSDYWKVPEELNLDLALLNESPVIMLAQWKQYRRYNSIERFIDFMHGRYEQHGQALKQHLPDMTNTLAPALQKIANAYPGGTRIGRAALDAFERLGITPLHSLAAGHYYADGMCSISPHQTLGIHLANIYTNVDDYRGVGPYMLATLLHEGIHAAHGDLQAGFGYSLDAHEQQAALITEIATELETHFALSDITTPEEVYTDLGQASYGNELGLYHMLAQRASKEVPIELLLEAHASPRDTNGPTSSRHQLRMLLDASVQELLPGEEGILPICHTYQEIKLQSGRQAYIKALLARIVTQVGESELCERQAQSVA